jgi:flagella basal body P-ring formation protein FlgA
MSVRLISGLLCVASLAGAQGARCQPVEGDRITARDVAAALPAFGSLPPDTPIAPAPLAGVRRVLRASEISALAQRYAVKLEDPTGVCFEYPLEPLDRAKAIEAMRLALADVPEAHIEIVEASQSPVPRGRIEFPRSGLAAPAMPTSREPVAWRGYVIYGESHRYSIWVRVLVSARMSRVVAVEKLARGTLVRAGQVRVETVAGFPGSGNPARTVDQVVGRIAARDIAAGSEIHLTQLTTPPDVARGDMVEVEVRSGDARLLLTGKAESAGRVGDAIAIRNLSNNRVFPARIEGKDKALVDTGLQVN